MRRLTAILCLTVVVLLGSTGVSFALPPCPSDQNRYYDNCFGNYTYPDGSKYIGEFRDGKRNGQGTYTYGPLSKSAGDKYVGEYRDSKKNGQGTYTYGPSSKWASDKYIGEYRDGKRNGQGTYTYGPLSKSAGDKYVGEYRDGKKNGQGTYIWSNGDKYVGEFRDGDFNGQGTKTYPDGSKYIGEFRDGKRNGQGTYIWSNGDKYVGDFRDGDFDGQGTKTFANGIIEEGIWKDHNFQYTQKVTPPKFAKKSPSSTPQRRTDPDKAFSASLGSGFAVSSNGHVITNNHVINGCNKVKIHHDGRSISARVITYDPQNDLALLKGDFRPSTVLPLSTKNPELLQDIYVAGYPFGRKFSTSVKVTKGIISSLTGIGNNYSNIQIDAALQPGNSGGPILNDRGNVVGVAVARLDKIKTLKNLGSLPENTNFGIKTSVVRNILKSNNVSLPSPNGSSISKTRLGKMISDGTYYLSCWTTTAQIEKMRSKKVMLKNLD